MDPVRLSPERDPEFEPLVSERLRAAQVPPGAYQRLVANPFLGFFGLIAWGAAIYYCVLRDVPGVRADHDFNFRFVMVLALLAISIKLPRLFHYHCRDCGSTGPLHRWKDHVCYRVAARQLAGRPRRFHGPSPIFQVLIWMYALALLFAAVHSVRW